MSVKIIALVAFTQLCFLPAAAVQADNAAAIQSCVGCHGPDGVSQCPDMPSIAGVPALTHEEAMFAFRDEARPCEQSEYRHGDTSRAKADMCSIAKALTEDEIVAIAAYFAGKTYVAMKQDTDAAKVAAGEVIHNRDCKRCHSDAGGNPDDEAGILAGQPMAYLARTFTEYRAGTREQPKKMKPKMDALSDADFDALVHFYASQQ